MSNSSTGPPVHSVPVGMSLPRLSELIVPQVAPATAATLLHPIDSLYFSFRQGFERAQLQVAAATTTAQRFWQPVS